MNQSKLSIIWVSVVAVILGIVVVAGCSAQTKKIGNTIYPNEVAESAKISDDYKDVSNELSDYAISQFYEISKIPHGNGNEWTFLDWLANWGKQNNLQTIIDSSKCVYFEVPATKGMENTPKIIFQAHADMVAKTTDQSIDMNTTAIDLVKDDNGAIHSKDHKTTIGADDAEGIITMLAIAKSDKIKHGPIRMIFTYDEEDGETGAKLISEQALDAPYLINLDGNYVGEVFCQSGGLQKATLSKTVTTQDAQNATEFSIDINNLEGGHSALDIEKNRANANIACRDLLSRFSESNIEYGIVSFDGGVSPSSLCDSAKLVVNIPKVKAEKAKETIDAYFNFAKTKYTDDVNANYSYAEKDATAASLSYNDSKTFVDSLNKFDYGVNKWSQKFDDLVETSSNIPIVKIQNGNIEFVFAVRSSIDDDIHSKIDYCKQVADQFGYNCKLDDFVNSWPPTSDTKLEDLMIESYKNSSGFEGRKTGIHGVLECSQFLLKNPNIKMISIGADVANEHSVTETFYTKSLPSQFASILYLLANADRLK